MTRPAWEKQSDLLLPPMFLSHAPSSGRSFFHEDNQQICGSKDLCENFLQTRSQHLYCLDFCQDTNELRSTAPSTAQNRLVHHKKMDRVFLAERPRFKTIFTFVSVLTFVTLVEWTRIRQRVASHTNTPTSRIAIDPRRIKPMARRIDRLRRSLPK